MKNKENSEMIRLIKEIAELGYRVFNIQTAKEIGTSIGLKETYVKDYLLRLYERGYIEHISKGLYALASIYLSGHPIHDYEIAMALIENKGAISHWSAMRFHGLTDQLPRTVFVSITNRTDMPKIGNQANKSLIRGINFQFVKVSPDHFFGTKKVILGDSQIIITDLEKTLIDALNRPKYCGGFMEVYEGFKKGLDNAEINRLIEYAIKYGDSSMRRVGFILERLGITEARLALLNPWGYVGYVALDSSCPRKGACNKKWGIQENVC